MSIGIKNEAEASMIVATIVDMVATKKITMIAAEEEVKTEADIEAEAEEVTMEVEEEATNILEADQKVPKSNQEIRLLFIAITSRLLWLIKACYISTLLTGVISSATSEKIAWSSSILFQRKNLK